MAEKTRCVTVVLQFGKDRADLGEIFEKLSSLLYEHTNVEVVTVMPGVARIREDTPVEGNMDVRKMLRDRELVTEADFPDMKLEKVHYNPETGEDGGQEWLRVWVPTTHPDGPMTFDLKKVEGGYRWTGEGHID